MIIFPQNGESTKSFLARRGGGNAMLLINVVIDGVKTSAWENTTRNGAWRARHGKSAKGKLIDHSDIRICEDTMSLSCTDATELAKELPDVAQRLPNKPIGNIKRADPEAIEVLESLERGVKAIRTSLKQDLTTPIFLMYRELGHHVDLIAEEEPSPYAYQLLDAFGASQTLYAALPELGRFVGGVRGSGLPSDKGGKIRAWIKLNERLDLQSGEHLVCSFPKVLPL